ncbi:MAG: hypothetical protein K1X78_26050 [Verrucomicrobiaceae bacterium]|nr:hypothetical protein [Verrucomicrobiaceae bacterium]
MSTARFVAAILAMTGTAVFTLFMSVFSAAAVANANAESIQRVKNWVPGFSPASLPGIIAGVWLLRAHRAGWAAIVSALPATAMGGVFVYRIAFS